MSIPKTILGVINNVVCIHIVEIKLQFQIFERLQVVVKW